jgi:hypothetical protein
MKGEGFNPQLAAFCGAVALRRAYSLVGRALRGGLLLENGEGVRRRQDRTKMLK